MKVKTFWPRGPPPPAGSNVRFPTGEEVSTKINFQSKQLHVSTITFSRKDVIHETIAVAGQTPVWLHMRIKVLLNNCRVHAQVYLWKGFPTVAVAGSFKYLWANVGCDVTDAATFGFCPLSFSMLKAASPVVLRQSELSWLSRDIEGGGSRCVDVRGKVVVLYGHDRKYDRKLGEGEGKMSGFFGTLINLWFYSTLV